MKWTVTILTLLVGTGLSSFSFHEDPFCSKCNRKPISQLTCNEPYLNFCKKAVADSATFDNFKRNPVYNIFYENTTVEQAEQLLAFIKERAPEFLEKAVIEKVSNLDQVGGAQVHTFEAVGSLSPSTVHYLKIAADLKKQFSDQKDLRIIEIGGGSGGLCKVMHDLFAISHYTIVDLPETLELIKKHLDVLGIKNVEYLTPDQLKTQSCDLLVSIYSFTESNVALQNRYIKKLFPFAKHGYFTCDFFPNHFLVKPLRKERLLEKIQHLHKDCLKLPEEPETGKDNFRLIWG